VSAVTYTVITNNYDNLRSVTQEGNFVCFTDRPRCMPPWQIFPCPRLFSDEVRNTRIPKCLPHMLFQVDASIYLDGAFLPLTSPDKAIDDLLGDADIAAFAHPGGHTSYHDERNFYRNLHGFVPDDVEKTYQRYVAEDVPVSNTFYMGGVIIRRHNAATERFNRLWWQEYMAGTYNDQFSLNLAICKTGIKVATIPGVGTQNRDYFGYRLHANSGCGDNPEFEGENQFWTDTFADIRRMAGEKC
jgi:hypothetical protein